MEELLDPPPKAGADPKDPDGAEEVEAPKGVAKLDDAACPPPDVAPPKTPGVEVVAPNAGVEAPNEVLDEVGAAPKGVLDGVDPYGVALEDGVGAPKTPDVADPNAGVVLEGADVAPKGVLEGVGAVPKGEGVAEVAEAPVVAPNRAVGAGAAPKDGIDAVWDAPKEGVDEDPGAVGVAAAVKPPPKEVGVDEGAPKAAGVVAGAENPDEASALVAAGAEKAVAEEDDEGGANDVKPVDGAAVGAVVGAAGAGAAKKAVAAAGADGRAEGADVVAGIVKAAVGDGWTCATDAGGSTVATGTAGVESESERAGEGSGFGGGGRTPDNCTQRKKCDEHCYIRCRSYRGREEEKRRVQRTEICRGGLFCLACCSSSSRRRFSSSFFSADCEMASYRCSAFASSSSSSEKTRGFFRSPSAPNTGESLVPLALSLSRGVSATRCRGVLLRLDLGAEASSASSVRGGVLGASLTWWTATAACMGVVTAICCCCCSSQAHDGQMRVRTTSRKAEQWWWGGTLGGGVGLVAISAEATSREGRVGVARIVLLS
jgi:hypothetical protein